MTIDCFSIQGKNGASLLNEKMKLKLFKHQNDLSHQAIVKKKSDHKFFHAVLKKSGVASPQKFSVSFVGDQEVGKTKILQRITTGDYQKNYEPTISDMFKVEVQKQDSSKSLLTVYDTSGSLSFPAMMRVTVSQSDACVVVFSLSSKKSLQFAEKKLTEIKQIKGNNFPCILVGNQSDRTDREVSFEKALRCAVRYNCSYLEVSAELNKNIKELFASVLNKINTYQRHFKNSNNGKLSYKRLSDSTLL